MTVNKYPNIRKANEIEWHNRLFTTLASPIANFYTASRGVQSFEKAVRCQIFATLFCLINGVGRGAVTGTLSAKATKIALMVYPFAAFGFWSSFAPNDVDKKRQRGASSFIYLSHIAKTFADHKLALGNINCVTQENKAETEAEVFDTLMKGYHNHYSDASKNIFREIEQKAANTKNHYILKNLVPSSILSNKELIAARISCWIQEYALTTNLSKEIDECKLAENKIQSLYIFLKTLNTALIPQKEKTNISTIPAAKLSKASDDSVQTIKSIVLKIRSHIDQASPNDRETIHQMVSDTLNSFLIYITNIHTYISDPLQQKINSTEDKNEKKALKQTQKELMGRLYNDILNPQLSDHQALIRNKKTVASLFLGFIFIIGNIIVYSTFAVIGGKDLIEKTTHWLARYLEKLLLPRALLFLQSPPALFSYLFASLLFGIPTLLVSWYFGGGALNKFLTQISVGDNKNPLKKTTVPRWLVISGFLISAFGSNMLFFHYIATTFIATPLYFQLWLEFSIFMSTAALFIVLYTDSAKKYQEELREFINDKLKNKHGWQRTRTKIFSGIGISFIFSILCFVSVYADTISAKRLLSSKNTKFLNICYLNLHQSNVLYLLIGSFGFFSIIFNVVYAFKAAVLIYKKLVTSIQALDFRQKSEGFSISIITLTAILLLSIQSHSSTLNLGLMIMTCFLCYVLYKASVKISLQNNPCPSRKTSTTLAHSFIIFLAVVLLSEAIMTQTMWTKDTVITIYTPLVMTIGIIITGYVCWNITSRLFATTSDKNLQNDHCHTVAPCYLKPLQYLLFATLSIAFLSLCFKTTYLGPYADYATIGLLSFCIIGIIIKNLVSNHVNKTLLEEETIQQISYHNANYQHC